VDGFRFDLASALARGTHGFERQHAFFPGTASKTPCSLNLNSLRSPGYHPGGLSGGELPRAGGME